MAYRGVWIYLLNQTQANISLTSGSITHGKWVTNMPTTVEPGQLVVGEASSISGTWGDCTGSAKYLLGDNRTTINISFDVPFDGSNSGGMKLSGSGASTYSGGEYTSKTFTTPCTFPTSADYPSVYFKIALANTGGG